MYNLFYCVGVFFFPDIVGFDKVGEHEILLVLIKNITLLSPSWRPYSGSGIFCLMAKTDVLVSYSLSSFLVSVV
jgi:hypothetical protein